MRLDCRATSLIFCSSHSPISRNRCVTSFDAESFLMHTTVPASIWLRGQTFGPAHSPSKIVYVRSVFFNVGPEYANRKRVASDTRGQGASRHYHHDSFPALSPFRRGEGDGGR